MMSDFKIPFFSFLARAATTALFLSILWLHCSAKIAFVTADLGRHIYNGALFIKNHHILATNFYSYTHPDFPTICHHWGAGVVFYLIHQLGGFSFLSVFYTALLVAACVLAMWAVLRKTGFWPVMLMSLIALPAIASRTEIRPEGFTTLFLMLEYFILSRCRDRSLSRRWLWVIPLIQWAWINAHILFFTGFVLLALFVIDAFFDKEDRDHWKELMFIGVVAAGVSLLNPFGWSGLLEPLNIFRSYGYELAENKDVFFMMKRFPGNMIYGYAIGLFLASFAMLGLRFYKERDIRAVLLDALIILFFGLMAMKAIRAISMFGFFFIPFGAVQMIHLIRLYGEKWGRWPHRLIVAAVVVLVGLSAVDPRFFFSPLRRQELALSLQDVRYRSSLFSTLARPVVWSGLTDNIGASADFFKAQGMRGPVFNNYDIGGYMIFYLFPQERPFVDNRPEAYPTDFFHQVYAPMQEDDSVWLQMDQKYGFEVIYFYRHDQTTWAQPFLIRRLDDPAWAPVFVDGYTIILAKRAGVNQKVIERFELPRDIFRVRKN